MAATTVKRQTVRKDPVSRLIDPAIAWMKLDNEDPERSYSQVHRDTVSISAYQARGYEVEQYTVGGVKPRGVRNVQPLLGKDIEIRDCVLMSIPTAEKLEMEEYGRRLVDAKFAKIHNRKAVRDEVFEQDIPPRSAEGELLIDVKDTSSPLRVKGEVRVNG